MSRSHWQDWLVMAVGLVLFSLPFAVSYALPPGASAVLVRTAFVAAGLAAVLLGGIGVASDQTWEEWAILLLGLWLLAAPWVLRFGASASPKWVSVAAGLAAIVLAALSIVDRRSAT